MPIPNRNFTFTTGNNKRSQLQRLKNGVSQVFIFANLLFNIYTSDLPITVFRKYAYADCQAIMTADGHWQTVEGVLSKDMATIGKYLQTWKLEISATNMVSAVFQINKEAKR